MKFFRWSVFNFTVVIHFFVFVYCIVATTKTKSWTEPRLSFYIFVFIHANCWCCVTVFVCVCGWACTFAISAPVWCSQEDSTREYVCVCMSDSMFNVFVTFERFCCFWTSCFLTWPGPLQSSCDDWYDGKVAVFKMRQTETSTAPLDSEHLILNPCYGGRRLSESLAHHASRYVCWHLSKDNVLLGYFVKIKCSKIYSATFLFRTGHIHTEPLLKG